MITKRLSFIACGALFAAICLPAYRLPAQAPAINDIDKDSLRMVVNYGAGKEKGRKSHHGIMEPVGLPLGQVVAITLEFPKNRAGQPVRVFPLDGGQITAPAGPLLISADGTVGFGFETGGTPGLYRLMVRGADEHEIQLYAFDPNRPVNRRRGPGAH